MRLKHIYLIFKKELLESLRDPKVLLTNFFLPILSLPLIGLLAFILKGIKDEQQRRDVYIIGIGKNVPITFVDELKKHKSIQFKHLPEAPLAKELLLSKIKKGVWDLAITTSNKEQIVVMTDTSEAHHLRAWEVIRKSYGKWKKIYLPRKPAQSENKKRNIKLESLVPQTKMAAGMLGGPIGSYVLFILLISVFNPTLNATIGEKERQTLGQILLTPVRISDLLIGKLMNIGLQGLIGLTPYALISALLLYSSQQFLKNHFIGTGLFYLIPIVITTLSMTLLIASFCFVFGTYAKTLPQAHSLMSLATFVVFIPSVVFNVLDVELNYTTAWIPLLNYSLAFKNFLLGQYQVGPLLIANISNIITSYILLKLAEFFFIKRHLTN